MRSAETNMEVSDTLVPDVWARLHRKSFERPWSEKALADLCALPGAIAFSALIGDKPVGFVLARQTVDEAEILTICVLPEARRHGVARRLISELMSRLNGPQSLFLEVDALNEAAIRLYASLGFTRAGKRKAYYVRTDGSKADALLLRRDLSDELEPVPPGKV